MPVNSFRMVIGKLGDRLPIDASHFVEGTVQSDHGDLSIAFFRPNVQSMAVRELEESWAC